MYVLMKQFELPSFLGHYMVAQQQITLFTANLGFRGNYHTVPFTEPFERVESRFLIRSWGFPECFFFNDSGVGSPSSLKNNEKAFLQS